MIRKHFFLPQDQIDWIKKVSMGGGLSESEVVRRVIERHILTFTLKASVSPSKGDD